MLQGLGQKHQPMLPAKGEEDEMELDHASNERVENWAKAVSTDGVGHEEGPVEPAEDEDRDGRFDRRLKEVRVGESPSRPWGISVPFLDPPEGQRPVSPPPAPVSVEHAPKPVGKCPFGHASPQGKGEEKLFPSPSQAQDKPVGRCPFPPAQTSSKLPTPNLQQQPFVQTQPAFIQPTELQISNGSAVPQMIFTGPVFIGYPMEQAIAFMQQCQGTQ